MVRYLPSPIIPPIDLVRVAAAHLHHDKHPLSQLGHFVRLCVDPETNVYKDVQNDYHEIQAPSATFEAQQSPAIVYTARSASPARPGVQLACDPRRSGSPSRTEDGRARIKRPVGNNFYGRWIGLSRLSSHICSY